tara:strand:+ start:3986 stop:4798 length:813 start_codon:yes stop_codon:yes gene_type:complete
LANKRFIITGTSGFIGGALYRFFQSQKINCIGISRSEHANSDYCVKNYSELSKLFDKDTYLISFAGDNRKIDENELQMVKDLSTTYQHQMFYISSAQVYGLKHNYSNIETSPLDGVTDYAKNKIIAEQLVKKNHGKIFRLSNVYGKGMSKDTVWYDILKQVKANKDLITLKNKLAIRDFLYIDDLCLIISKIVTSDKNFDVINVGSGIGTSLITITNHIHQIIYPNSSYPEIYSDNDEDICNILDIDLAAREFGWEPRVSLQNGINLWLA